MPAIIGGSPSTGSSLLVNILNRHSDIAAGPETHFFTIPRLYTDWNPISMRLLPKVHISVWAKRFKSPGVHRYNGINLPLNENLQNLKGKSCDSYLAFSNILFKQEAKNYWVEKTPANSYCFDHFLKHVNNGKVIMMIRDPYDTVASLLARGITIPKACALYLTNTMANINLRSSDAFYTVKYESLVNDTVNTVMNLCKFLNVPYEETMLQTELEVIKMDGWKNNEKGKVSNQSVSRFDEQPLKKQKEIISALSQIRLVSKSWPFEYVQMDSISDICNLFGYTYRPEEEKFSFSLWKEKLISTVKLYPTNLFNYPVTFR